MSWISATGSGSVDGTNRDRIVALACAPVMVWTGGKPRFSALSNGAICGSRLTRTAVPVVIRARDGGAATAAAAAGSVRPAAGRPRRCARYPSRSCAPEQPAAGRTSADSSGRRPTRAATASPGLPIGAATQPNPSCDSSRSNAMPCARTLASSVVKLGTAGNRVPRLAGLLGPPRNPRHSKPGSPCRRRCSARADDRRPGWGSRTPSDRRPSRGKPRQAHLELRDARQAQWRGVIHLVAGRAARTRRSWCTASEPNSTKRMPSS